MRVFFVKVKVSGYYTPQGMQCQIAAILRRKDYMATFGKIFLYM